MIVLFYLKNSKARNSEIVLEMKCSDKRIYPAIDAQKFGTRKDDLLSDAGNLHKGFHTKKDLVLYGHSRYYGILTR